MRLGWRSLLLFFPILHRTQTASSIYITLSSFVRFFRYYKYVSIKITSVKIAISDEQSFFDDTNLNSDAGGDDVLNACNSTTLQVMLIVRADRFAFSYKLRTKLNVKDASKCWVITIQYTYSYGLPV